MGVCSIQLPGNMCLAVRERSGELQLCVAGSRVECVCAFEVCASLSCFCGLLSRCLCAEPRDCPVTERCPGCSASLPCSWWVSAVVLTLCLLGGGLCNGFRALNRFCCCVGNTVACAWFVSLPLYHKWHVCASLLPVSSAGGYPESMLPQNLYFA